MAKDFELSNHQKELIKEGFVSELGTTNFTVLLVIKALMNEGGVVSNKEVERISGLSHVTVVNAIKTLVAMGLLAKEVTAPNGKKQTAYNILSGMNSKEFILKFCQLYEETYGVKYLVNWKTEGARVKKCLIGKFTDEELIIMLDTAFKLYPVKWKSKDYPAPTIGMLCSWLGNQALKIGMEEKAKRDKEDESSRRAHEYQLWQQANWERLGGKF